MKLIFAIVCLLVTGCARQHVDSMSGREPAGELLASIKMTEGAFSGRSKGDTGYFFYVENSAGVIGPTLTGYDYRDGELRDLIGGGSDSASIVQTIREVGLEPFDFAAEVATTTAQLDQAAQAKGERFMGPTVLDGAEYEITVHTPGGVFVLKAWNPGPTIDAFAPHSAKIAKLKRVLDILAQYYGRTKFGL